MCAFGCFRELVPTLFLRVRVLVMLTLPVLQRSSRNPEETCLRAFAESHRNAPAVLYWPHVVRLAHCPPAIQRASLAAFLSSCDSSSLAASRLRCCGCCVVAISGQAFCEVLPA